MPADLVSQIKNNILNTNDLNVRMIANDFHIVVVIIPDGGRWNCRRQIELGREDMLGRYLHRLTEASEMELIKRGVDATILISNVEGMPFSHFCSKKSKSLLMLHM